MTFRHWFFGGFPWSLAVKYDLLDFGIKCSASYNAVTKNGMFIVMVYPVEILVRYSR